jgi:hypothetical protein
MFPPLVALQVAIWRLILRSDDACLYGLNNLATGQN